jgi:hypothetical protein
MQSRSLNLLATLALIAPVAASQTSGTITLSGVVPTSCSITNTTNNPLSATIALGALTPANNNTLTTGSVQARIRGNKAYFLSAQASALTFGGLGVTAGGDTIGPGDLAFGITNINGAGANVAPGSDTIATGPPTFNYSAGYPAATNGLTPFVAGTHGTLNDLAVNRQILNGTRVSRRGNDITNNNFILVTFGVATLRQYFTPNTSFSSTVTLTLTCP